MNRLESALAIPTFLDKRQSCGIAALRAIAATQQEAAASLYLPEPE